MNDTTIPSPKTDKFYHFWASATIAVPLVATFIALGSLYFYPPGATVISVAILMYVLTALGITAGYHRLYTHQSFKATKVIKSALHILGAMAGQGGLIFWVASHRQHHQCSDQAGDPHSPLQSFYHAHTGWMLSPHSIDYRYAKDLMKQRDVVNRDLHYHHYLLLGLIFPAILCGLLEQSLTALLQGFLWGGLVRMCLLHHSTWAVNSVCHLWGRQPFRSKDNSRNNYTVALLTLGEGFHNAHHAFPRSARHGLLWWELDLTYLAIRLWEKLGLVSEVQVPGAAQIQQKQIEQSVNNQ